MSNNIISINYIYLLQEREFTKTKENIYKVGMSQKENHKRFNQYPKGSILLFQMICNNCKNIEKCLIKIFKENFKLRNDIGNEYFEGDYKSMIDIIYFTIKNEKEEYTNFKQTKQDNKEESDNEQKECGNLKQTNEISEYKYFCKSCDYKCSKKSSWLQHLNTSKHQSVYLSLNKANVNKTKFICDTCGKNFKHQSSHCRHKKICQI